MKNVLLVDDEIEPDYSILFEKDGTYNAVVINSPNQALKIVEEGGIDLLMTDFDMPKMNGATLIERVHKISPGTRLILATGHSKNSIAGILSKLENQGITIAYLKKPYGFNEAKKLIKSLIGE